ncbi:MAG: hypothetical protein HPY57_14475 [Ignavibacteria bacterium]|nr:hypothetical protein [Ignavibacteria bacterium]
MKWSDDKKSAYLRGYTELSDLDKEIAKTKTHLDKGAKQWQADWEKENKKELHTYDQDAIRKGMMYTNVDNDFRYSTDISTFFDDPTYLGYNVKIAIEDSPLWNYGYGLDETQIGETGTALYFINKYGKTIGEIGQRKPILFEFISRFENLFGRTLLNNTDKYKSYYIETISGLDKLMAKMVKYPEDKLTVTLSENVSLLATYIAELYNNLSYSYNYQRYVIPENCLRFDLLVEITDIRIFRNIGTDDNGNIFYNINSNPPKIIYRLHDCNFDFSNTKPFAEAISMAGFGSTADKTPRNLTFDIKYKSITREFISPLINNSYTLLNKSSKIINNTILSNAKYFSTDIFSDNKINIKKEQEKFSSSESLKSATGELSNPNEKLVQPSVIDEKRRNAMKNDIGQIPHIKTNIGYNIAVSKTIEGYVQQEENPYHIIRTKDVKSHDHTKTNTFSTTIDKLKTAQSIYGSDKKDFLENLKQIAENNIDVAKEKMISRFTQIRGSLINEILRQVRKPFQMPNIYPDNVYNPDFRKLSLENFVRGLGSDILNEGENAARNELNSLLGG